ncbi:helix-turn-helix domain-containing protein [Flavobacteriales bacterium]|nr:helix-turn-helix domain-containing protein [Flavobacteriales bacterium]
MLFFGKLDGEVVEEIGLKIRLLRKSKRYSQQQLADKVGVSRKHISDIEAGRGTTLLIFVKLLKEFNKADKLLEMLTVSSISPKDQYQKDQK